jgi:hypothetical protein
MDQTTVTLLLVTGGAAVGVAAIAGGYLAAQAARRDADAAIHSARATRPNGESTRPDAAAARATSAASRPAAAAPPSAAAGRRSSAAASAVQATTLTRKQRELRVVELHRTRTILLGLLNALEALALGETSRATSARAELADVGECDISLVGDAGLVDRYLLTAEMLRTQIGRGLPAEAASQVASLRVELLTALAQQERRLSRGEELLTTEPPRPLRLEGLTGSDQARPSQVDTLTGPPDLRTSPAVRPSPVEPVTASRDLRASASGRRSQVEPVPTSADRSASPASLSGLERPPFLRLTMLQKIVLGSCVGVAAGVVVALIPR